MEQSFGLIDEREHVLTTKTSTKGSIPVKIQTVLQGFCNYRESGKIAANTISTYSHFS